MIEASRVAARRAARRFGLPSDVRLEAMSLSENAVWKASSSDGRRVLRLHRRGYHSREEILSELSWLDALAESTDVCVPRAFSAPDGERVARVELEDGETFATLLRWEEGESPPSACERTETLYERLGETSAALHAHAREWNSSSSFVRKSWNVETIFGDSPTWGRWSDAPGIDSERSRLFSRVESEVSRRLESFGMERDVYGAAHCDMRPANVLLDGETLRLIDFDDCGYGWFLYDAATSVSFFEHDRSSETLLSAWLRGYRRRASSPREAEEILPSLVMLRRLLLTAWIGSRSDSDLPRRLGGGFAESADSLCRRYLRRFER